MNSYRNGMRTTIAVNSLYTKLKQRRTLENRSREQTSATEIGRMNEFLQESESA